MLVTRIENHGENAALYLRPEATRGLFIVENGTELFVGKLIVLRSIDLLSAEQIKATGRLVRYVDDDELPGSWRARTRGSIQADDSDLSRSLTFPEGTLVTEYAPFPPEHYMVDGEEATASSV